jgi:outer membrane protein TolC
MHASTPSDALRLRWLPLVLALALTATSSLASAQSPPPDPAPSSTDPVDPPPPSRRVLTLQEAQQQLLDASFELRLNEQTLNQVKLLETQALSIWIPTISVAARYTLRDQEITLAFPNPLSALTPYLDSVYQGDPALQQLLAQNPQIPDARVLASTPSEPSVVQFRHNYQLVGTVSQTLFNARAFPLLNLADLSVLRAQHAKQEIAYQLNAALNQLYFNAVQFRRLIRVSQRNAQLARIPLERATAAADAGVGNRFEVTRAKVNLSKAEREVTRAQLAYSLSTQALASFLLTDNDFDIADPPQLSPPSSCCDALRDQAQASRPDLRGADLTIAFEQERIRENEATYWPVMSAELQGVVQRASAFSGNPFFWTLTIEAESIQIIREAAAEFDKPVMLYSIGKDSSVLLRLALKAFAPGRIPFPLLHVDTTWKFREMIAFRDQMREATTSTCSLYTNPAGANGRSRRSRTGATSTPAS